MTQKGVKEIFEEAARAAIKHKVKKKAKKMTTCTCILF
jgi:hypothetical protein